MQGYCPHCGRDWNLPPRSEGRKAKCKHCENVFVVPAESAVIISDNSTVEAGGINIKNVMVMPSQAPSHQGAANEIRGKTCAVLSITFGLIGLFIGGAWIGIPFLIVGIIGLTRAETGKYRRYCIWGIALNSINTICHFFVLYVWLKDNGLWD